MGKIYSGPLQELILEDSQNGSFSIKELLEGDYEEQDFISDIFDGSVPLKRNYKAQVKIANTDSATLAEIKKRVHSRQTVRILWQEVQVQFRNVFIQLNMARGYKPGEAHALILTVQTQIDDDVTLSNIYANPTGLEAFYDPYTQAGN